MSRTYGPKDEAEAKAEEEYLQKHRRAMRQRAQRRGLKMAAAGQETRHERELDDAATESSNPNGTDQSEGQS